MLPFTREQFLALFVRYNQAIWPAQAATGKPILPGFVKSASK